MGRTPCCEKIGLNRGKWSAEEDEKLVNYINANGEGSWRSLPKNAGLLRCGKSCRLRWINYLRTDVKRGNFTEQEDQMIVKLHKTLGNRWSVIASQIAGRTDNEIKNYWNSHLSRKTYRYRFTGEAEPTLSTAEMINMAKKKRSIGRTEAPPHKDTNTSADQEQEQPSSSESDQPPPALPVEDLLRLEPSRTNEEKEKGMVVGWPHDASLMLSPNEVEVDHDISMHLNYFLEDDHTTHQCHNKTHALIMDKHNTNTPPAYMTDHQETDCAHARWTSSLDCLQLYDCLSPILYFTDDLLHWDHNAAPNDLNLWNHEDHNIIWS